MKNLFTYLLAFVAVTTVISCSKSDESEEPVPGPTITWASNPDFNKVDITDEMDVKIKVDAPAGIKTFKVAVESEALKAMSITELDLIEPGSDIETIVKMIWGNAGSPKDKTSYTLDISNLVPMINVLTQEESDHTFTVTVEDMNDQKATQTAVFHRVAEEGQDFTETKVPGVEFDMVYVKGGTFSMGATEEQGLDGIKDNEKPVHSVTLSDYYIGRFEVTQGLWKAVMSGNNPSGFKKGDEYPVEKVSWNDIQHFLIELNRLSGKKYALPTEAQWEYAARGGAKSKEYKYSGSNTIDDVAWYTDKNFEKTTHSVGEKQANELGLYDMSGNVAEWCSDWYGDYSSDSQTNPTGPTTGSYRVLRGGSWSTEAKDCRVSYRSYLNPDLPFTLNSNGFRVVLLP